MSKLAEIFDVEPVTVSVETQQTTAVTVVDDNPEDADFEHTRVVQLELIEQGRAAVNTAMRIAAESENPRAIETLAGMLKTVSDMNAQLLGLSKSKNDIKAVKVGKGQSQNPQIPQIGTQNILIQTDGSNINKMLADRIKNGT